MISNDVFSWENYWIRQLEEDREERRRQREFEERRRQEYREERRKRLEEDWEEHREMMQLLFDSFSPTE